MYETAAHAAPTDLTTSAVTQWSPRSPPKSHWADAERIANTDLATRRTMLGCASLSARGAGGWDDIFAGSEYRIAGVAAIHFCGRAFGNRGCEEICEGVADALASVSS